MAFRVLLVHRLVVNDGLWFLADMCRREGGGGVLGESGERNEGVLSSNGFVYNG